VPDGADPPTPDLPALEEVVPPNGAPDSIEGWKELSNGLLSDHCCAFHRNAGISTRYAWVHTLQPAIFKWAAMAAIASHHVRLALYPLRVSADRTGYVDVYRSPVRRRRLLFEDANTIRATNNAIYDDIFWVHLAYASADDGIDRLRRLLHADPHYERILSGFEALDQARQALEAATTSDEERRAANELVWEGNVGLLEHEQSAVVQPNFDLLSCASARLISIGSATTFEVRGVRQEMRYFTSFYLYSLTRGAPAAVRTQTFPRITRYDDRWRWLEMRVVPRFRMFDTDQRLLEASIRRVLATSRVYEAMPCIVPG
jgi:hypothetical protein